MGPDDFFRQWESDAHRVTVEEGLKHQHLYFYYGHYFICLFLKKFLYLCKVINYSFKEFINSFSTQIHASAQKQPDLTNAITRVIQGNMKRSAEKSTIQRLMVDINSLILQSKSKDVSCEQRIIRSGVAIIIIVVNYQSSVPLLRFLV